MIRRIAALLTLVGLLDLAQVQLIDQVGDEIRHVVLGQPLAQTGRKKKILFRKIRPVDLRHIPRLATSQLIFNHDSPAKRDYSEPRPAQQAGGKLPYPPTSTL